MEKCEADRLLLRCRQRFHYSSARGVRGWGERFHVKLFGRLSVDDRKTGSSPLRPQVLHGRQMRG